MTRRDIYRCCVLFGLTVGVPCGSQVATSQHDLIRQLQSPSWVERSRAFADLQRQPRGLAAPEVRSVLLAVFELENRVVITTLRDSKGAAGVSEKYGEEFGEYYAQLFDACLQYCDKGSLLAVMLRNSQSGSPIQQHAVELLGIVRSRGFSIEQRGQIDSALLASATDTVSFLVRESALVALQNVIHADHGLAAAMRTRIHDAAVKSAADRYPNVRVAAVRTLGDIGNPADIVFLRSVAAHDTARGRSHGRSTYPVQDEARRAIAKIIAK